MNCIDRMEVGKCYTIQVNVVLRKQPYDCKLAVYTGWFTGRFGDYVEFDNEKRYNIHDINMVVEQENKMGNAGDLALCIDDVYDKTCIGKNCDKCNCKRYGTGKCLVQIIRELDNGWFRVC